MRKRLSSLVLIGGVIASLSLAAPANAAPLCVGTQQTAGVCAWLEKTTVYQDCVYVGPPPCIPVNVPGYDLECAGWIRDQWILVCS
jgi:hypothetical protein